MYCNGRANVFTLSTYQAIVAAVTTHLVAVRLEQPVHPLLTEVKRIPLLHKYSDRLAAVIKFREEAERATSFLVPNRGTVEVPSDLRLEQQRDSNSSAEAMIEMERLAARLSQAADLACTASGELDYNPFSGLCFVGMALVPQAVWSGANETHDVNSTDSACHRLKHSCIPNVHLEAVWNSANNITGERGLSIRSIALRNISPHEELSYCYIDTSSARTLSDRQDALSKKRQEVCVCPEDAEYVCDCERCAVERRGLESYFSSIIGSYLAGKGFATLSQLVAQYNSCDVSASSPSLQTVLSSPLSQCLLLEVLSISAANLITNTKGQSTESLFRQLVTARSLADNYMQEGNLCDSMVLYCAIVLAFSAHGCTDGHDREASDLTQLVGDVVLSIGNALLDASLTLAIQRNGGSGDERRLRGDDPFSLSDEDGPRAALIADMLTCAPWKLCHRVWRVGEKLLKGSHKALAESCNKLDSYLYELNGTEDLAFEASQYHKVSVSSAADRQKTKSSAAPDEVDRSPSIYLSKHPLLSAEECLEAISLAEQHASQSTSGWTTARHYAVPTTDIPIHASPALLAWFNEIMKSRLGAMLRGQFVNSSVVESTGCVVCVHDAFIVKYQCDDEDDISNSNSLSAKQRYLPLHSDQSTHSLTVALNDRGEYAGGGTYFAALDTALRPDKGHVLSFCGELLHGGDPIVSGTRYILAIFLLLQTDTPKLVRTSGLRDSKKRKADECSGGLATLFRDRTAALNCGNASVTFDSVAQVEVHKPQGMFSFSFEEGSDRDRGLPETASSSQRAEKVVPRASSCEFEEPFASAWLVAVSAQGPAPDGVPVAANGKLAASYDAEDAYMSSDCPPPPSSSVRFTPPKPSPPPSPPAKEEPVDEVVPFLDPPHVVSEVVSQESSVTETEIETESSLSSSPIQQPESESRSFGMFDALAEAADLRGSLPLTDHGPSVAVLTPPSFAFPSPLSKLSLSSPIPLTRTSSDASYANSDSADLLFVEQCARKSRGGVASSLNHSSYASSKKQRCGLEKTAASQQLNSLYGSFFGFSTDLGGSFPTATLSDLMNKGAGTTSRSSSFSNSLMMNSTLDQVPSMAAPRTTTFANSSSSNNSNGSTSPTQSHQVDARRRREEAGVDGYTFNGQHTLGIASNGSSDSIAAASQHFRNTLVNNGADGFSFAGDDTTKPLISSQTSSISSSAPAPASSSVAPVPWAVGGKIDWSRVSVGEDPFGYPPDLVRVPTPAVAAPSLAGVTLTASMTSSTSSSSSSTKRPAVMKAISPPVKHKPTVDTKRSSSSSSSTASNVAHRPVSASPPALKSNAAYYSGSLSDPIDILALVSSYSTSISTTETAPTTTTSNDTEVNQYV
eukprot:gene21376-27405_t